MRFIKLFITLIFIHLSFNVNLPALDPSYNLNHYISKNWLIEDGLPHISVSTKILPNSNITALNSFDDIMLIAVFGKGLIKLEDGKINELSVSNFEKLSSISLLKKIK